MYSLSILFLDGGGRSSGGFGGCEGLWIFVRPDHRVCKHAVQALTKAQLVLLQLRKTGHHQGVFEITCDQRLKQSHVVGGKLGHAIVKQSAHFAVASQFASL